MPAAKTEGMRPKGAGRPDGDVVPAAPRGGEAPSPQPRPRDRAAAQSSAALSPFTPIADYAFLSNCHTGALIAPDGSVDWLCVPRFDSASLFGALLDREAGSFRFAPFGINIPGERIYEPGTNSLLTVWSTPTGWVLVREALTIGPRRGEDRVTPHTRPPADYDADHMLVRLATCLQGEALMELVCEPVCDYGRGTSEWSVQDEGHRADLSAPGLTCRLQTNMMAGVEGESVTARRILREGEQVYSAFSWAEGLEVPETVEEATERLDATMRYWRMWLRGALLPDHRWRPAFQRSALVVKGLTYVPTGATVAALTTSLPETPGGERNWDYRYTWLRDSTFTLQALHYMDLDWEAREFMNFMGDLECNDDGALQVMYGIDGRRDLTESLREELSGYAGAHPVRIGNGAFDQRQNDVFGAALDSILLHTRPPQALRLLEADVLGGDGPRGEARGGSR
jgi:GH15 family glucan-1,4-alpha-glucosidase